MSEHDSGVNEAEELARNLERVLAERVPTKVVAVENRRPLAESFVVFLGQLVEFMERFKPLNQGQMAALLYFTENLDVRHIRGDASFVVLTLVDGAKNAARKLRRQRAS